MVTFFVFKPKCPRVVNVGNFFNILSEYIISWKDKGLIPPHANPSQITLDKAIYFLAGRVALRGVPLHFL